MDVMKRQELTALVDCFGDYHRIPDWFGTQAEKIESQKNPFKTLYTDLYANEPDKPEKFDMYAKLKGVQISPTDNPRLKTNCYVEIAAAYLIYETITFRRKLSIEKFAEYISQIPLISVKLNKAKAKILWGDGVKVAKKYGTASGLKEYAGYKTLLLIDPPYIGSEEQCDVEDFKEQHGNLARAIYRIDKKGNTGYFLYYCRISSSLRYEGKERARKDLILKRDIYEYFGGRGYFKDKLPLKSIGGQPIIEFFISNFKHSDSKPYDGIE
jgi:hypothetical protein